MSSTNNPSPGQSLVRDRPRSANNPGGYTPPSMSLVNGSNPLPQGGGHSTPLAPITSSSVSNPNSIAPQTSTALTPQSQAPTMPQGMNPSANLQNQYANYNPTSSFTDQFAPQNSNSGNRLTIYQKPEDAAAEIQRAAERMNRSSGIATSQSTSNFYEKIQKEIDRVKSGEIVSYNTSVASVSKDLSGKINIIIKGAVNADGKDVKLSLNQFKSIQNTGSYDPNSDRILTKADLVQSSTTPITSSASVSTPLPGYTTQKNVVNYGSVNSNPRTSELVQANTNTGTSFLDKYSNFAITTGRNVEEAYSRYLPKFNVDIVEVKTPEVKAYRDETVVGFAKDATASIIIPSKTTMISVNPQTIGKTLGTIATLGLYAAPVAGASFIGAGLTSGIATGFTGATREERIAGIGKAATNLAILGSPFFGKAIKELSTTEIGVLQYSLRGKDGINFIKPEFVYQEPNRILNIVNANTKESLGTRMEFDITNTKPAIVINPGRKTVVVSSSPFQRLFGKGVSSTTPIDFSLVYSGNPKDLVGYKVAKELLTGSQMKVKGKLSSPLSEYEARNVLRLIRPSITKYTLGGARGVLLVPNNGETRLTVYGISKEEPIIVPESGVPISGIKSRNSPIIAREIYQPGKFLGNKLKTDIEFYKSYPEVKTIYLPSKPGQVGPFLPIKMAGKDFEKFVSTSAVKPVGKPQEIFFPFVKPADMNILPGKSVMGQEFSEGSITRRILPSGRISRIAQPSTSKLFGVPSLSPAIYLEQQVAKAEDVFKVVETNPAKVKEVKFTTQQAKDITKSLRDVYGNEKPKPSTFKIDITKSPETKSNAENTALQNAYNIFQQIKSKVSIFQPFKTTNKAVKNAAILPTETTLDLSTYPNIVGGTSKSEYAGRGMYETETVTVFSPVQRPGITSQVIFSPQISVKTDSLLKTNARTDLRTNQELNLQLRQQNESKLRTEELLKSDLALTQSLKQEQKLNQEIKQDLLLQLRTEQKTDQQLVQKLRIEALRLKNPSSSILLRERVIPSAVRFGERESDFTLKKSSAKASKFLLTTKRFGKIKPLGEFRTPGEAFKFGVKNVKENLARTIKVTEARTGKPVKLPTLFGFRASKVDPFAVVQTNAIQSSGEKSEILSYKKAKSFWGAR